MDSERAAPPVTAITTADTTAWIAKAQGRVDPLRPAVEAAGGRSRTVRAVCVDAVSAAAYGGFMLSWPEPAGPDVTNLHHLPDGGFFLRLLELAYRPELAADPALHSCLRDGSRLELAFTNDVLQVQAAGPPGPYSMVRHHALVLHAATLWLDEPAASAWAQLGEAVARSLAAAPGGSPSAAELDEIEGRAFADLAALADRTVEPADAATLLTEPDRLADVLAFHRVATAAVAVLERDRRARGGSTLDWQAEQLAAATADDYLRATWTERL